MTETPREYIKRIDEKWRRNEIINRELIETIEWYELLDKRFKTTAKKELLDSFQRNQKAEQEWKRYTMIVSELKNIDNKYEEIREMKERLKGKKVEKKEKEKEFKESKLEWDETMLKSQMAKIEKIKKRLEIINSEVKELEKEIKNREQEIREIEETYGVKTATPEKEEITQGT